MVQDRTRGAGEHASVSTGVPRSRRGLAYEDREIVTGRTAFRRVVGVTTPQTQNDIGHGVCLVGGTPRKTGGLTRTLLIH